jgi:hypothetical protein
MSMVSQQDMGTATLLAYLQLTWADLGLLTSLEKLKTLNVAGVKYQATHASEYADALISNLQALHVPWWPSYAAVP